MRHWRWYSKLLFALLLAGFAYWVWPTPWQYFTISDSVMRVNRFTGALYVGRFSGWHELGPREEPHRSEEARE